jgi:phosphoglycerol transferase MdoB-like AlkP superfamily enzyme
MEVYQFSQPGIVADIGYALIFIGIAILLIGVVLILIKRLKKRNVKGGSIAALLIAGLVVTFSAIIIVPTGGSAQNSISIGDHYIKINAQYIGNQNFTTSDIKYAFVENINSGNVTLSTRNEGITLGNYNEGLFTTNNGASAYVITNNLTVLVVLTNSDIYLIMGNNNTDAMAHYFSKEVYPVNFS